MDGQENTSRGSFPLSNGQQLFIGFAGRSAHASDELVELTWGRCFSQRLRRNRYDGKFNLNTGEAVRITHFFRGGCKRLQSEELAIWRLHHGKFRDYLKVGEKAIYYIEDRTKEGVIASISPDLNSIVMQTEKEVVSRSFCFFSIPTN